jgi:hypothetical protein
MRSLDRAVPVTEVNRAADVRIAEEAEKHRLRWNVVEHVEQEGGCSRFAYW